MMSAQSQAHRLSVQHVWYKHYTFGALLCIAVLPLKPALLLCCYAKFERHMNTRAFAGITAAEAGGRLAPSFLFSGLAREQGAMPRVPVLVSRGAGASISAVYATALPRGPEVCFP